MESWGARWNVGLPGIFQVSLEYSRCFPGGSWRRADGAVLPGNYQVFSRGKAVQEWRRKIDFYQANAMVSPGKRLADFWFLDFRPGDFQEKTWMFPGLFQEKSGGVRTVNGGCFPPGNHQVGTGREGFGFW